MPIKISREHFSALMRAQTQLSGTKEYNSEKCYKLEKTNLNLDKKKTCATTWVETYPNQGT